MSPRLTGLIKPACFASRMNWSQFQQRAPLSGTENRDKGCAERGEDFWTTLCRDDGAGNRNPETRFEKTRQSELWRDWKNRANVKMVWIRLAEPENLSDHFGDTFLQRENKVEDAFSGASPYSVPVWDVWINQCVMWTEGGFLMLPLKSESRLQDGDVKPATHAAGGIQYSTQTPVFPTNSDYPWWWLSSWGTLEHVLSVGNLLDSPNFIGRVLHNVSFWEKVPGASHDDVISKLGHDKNCLSRPGTLWGQPSSLQRELKSSQLR